MSPLLMLWTAPPPAHECHRHRMSSALARRLPDNLGLGRARFAGPVETLDQLTRLLDCPFAHAHLHGRLSQPALKYFQVLMSPQHVVREAALQCFNVQHSLTPYERAASSRR